MGQAPQLSDLAQAMGVNEDLLKQMQRNALTKQYNLKLSFVVTEMQNDKPFFDSAVTYTGLPYPAIVAIEAEMVKLLEKLTILGGEVATGGALPPQS